MAKPKAVEHFQVSWDDDGNRRHQLAFEHKDAQEIARGFIRDHELNDVSIHKITTSVEPVEIVLPPEPEPEPEPEVVGPEVNSEVSVES